MLSFRFRRDCRLLFLLGVLALLGACASSGAALRLEDNLFAYANVVRWSDYLRAAHFIHPDDRPSQRELEFQLSRLENLQVVGYDEIQRTPGSSPNTMQQLVEIRVVNKHTKAERKVLDRQLWRYDEATDRWWLMSGLPTMTGQ